MSQDDRKPDSESTAEATAPAPDTDKTAPPQPPETAPDQAAAVTPAEKPKRARAPRKSASATKPKPKDKAASSAKAKSRTSTTKRTTGKTDTGKATDAPTAEDTLDTAKPIAAGAPTKLDYVWAMIGVVFFAGIGLAVLSVASLLSIAACAFTMASDEPASGLDGIRRDLRAYGTQILAFLDKPMGAMPFPFAPWPGKD